MCDDRSVHIACASSDAFHPVDRLIAVHAASLKFAQHDDCPKPADCSRSEIDAGQCRIWLNEARREIDRLRRGIDDRDRLGPDIVLKTSPFESDGKCDECEVAASTSFSMRRIYAVDPVGMIRLDSKTVFTQSPVVLNSHLEVTNLGTLLDALA